MSQFILLCAMLNVKPLLPEEIQPIEKMHKYPPCPTHRISDTGFRLLMIVNVYTVYRQAAASWLHAVKYNEMPIGSNECLCHAHKI